ncbi:chromosomal replication initiator protein DnaA [Leptospira noguchii]|uniref:Chromosomal replication initiator protein DnaA n=1 Tax=Leptospira noguchii serovar Autumnalis str. ZUN142 TaxID=1085540 RepID=M6UCH5_9LEPT|nr:chromosomal replication initiator protein DnaA [Leptospira noguchii]EMO40511.1 chromosomal replication initiator protein DnaA [Leptospira noguchii serovar Autumnalis str. ZUN142]UOG37811.1 chromosomal replication initiator protein DnaA [Leptospira noguchii]UOG48762.1 chromosomal replication initiator protein DnaA [Leptospira noguchii]
MFLEEKLNLVWNKILEEVSKKISPQYYERFINTLKLEAINSEKCTIIAPSATIKTHVERKYQSIIENAILETCGDKIPVEILIETKAASPLQSILEKSFDQKDFQFNPDYTFETFIVGDCNRLAYTAAKECVRKPAEINPLYIFGSVGVGKTHLLHAIGSELTKKDPWKTVCYVDISSFMNEFRFALQSRELIESFKIKYQSYNCLIVDDIQLLSTNAEKTQDEFFALFNFLFERKRQIVIASDRPSSELTIHERLKSRFVTGVQADIQYPDREIRKGIVTRHSKIMDLGLSEDILDFLADQIEEDTRLLLGALNDIYLYKKSYSLLFLNLDKVKEIVKNRLYRRKNVEFSHDRIIESVAKEFNLNAAEIMGKSRKKELIIPRHICFYLLHNVFNVNKSQVGRLFQTQHTTVIHGVRKTEELLSNNKEMRFLIERISSKYKLQ